MEPMPDTAERDMQEIARFQTFGSAGNIAEILTVNRILNEPEPGAQAAMVMRRVIPMKGQPEYVESWTWHNLMCCQDALTYALNRQGWGVSVLGTDEEG